MPESPKSTTYTAVGLVVAGFAIIAFGWYGAAQHDHTPAQIPYLISGGLSGLGFIGAGLTLVIVMESRRDRALLAAKLDQLLDAVSGGSAIVPVPGRPRAAAGGITDPTAVVATAEGLVVAGRAAYHRPSCHLLDGRADLPVITPGEAAAQELTPCRICDPEPATVG